MGKNTERVCKMDDKKFPIFKALEGTAIIFYN